MSVEPRLQFFFRCGRRAPARPRIRTEPSTHSGRRRVSSARTDRRRRGRCGRCRRVAAAAVGRRRLCRCGRLKSLPLRSPSPPPRRSSPGRGPSGPCAACVAAARRRARAKICTLHDAIATFAAAPESNQLPGRELRAQLGRDAEAHRADAQGLRLYVRNIPFDQEPAEPGRAGLGNERPRRGRRRLDPRSDDGAVGIAQTAHAEGVADLRGGELRAGEARPEHRGGIDARALAVDLEKRAGALDRVDPSDHGVDDFDRLRASLRTRSERAHRDHLADAERARGRRSP